MAILLVWAWLSHWFLVVSLTFTGGMTAIVWYCSGIRKKTPRLPPGPRRLPCVGNIFDVPTNQHWLKFAELGDVWGPISSLTVLGQTIIIVNSARVADDLLNVQAANFSDRPVLTLAGELAGFNKTLVFSDYNDRVRGERKILQRFMGAQNALVVPVLSSEIQKFLGRLVLSPSRVTEEIGRAVGAMTLRLAYGYHLHDTAEPDPLLDMFETLERKVVILLYKQRFLVDILPALRYWPEWLPGGGFQTTAKLWSKYLREPIDTALEYVKKAMLEGAAEPSFATNLLAENNETDSFIGWSAGVLTVTGKHAVGVAAQIEAFFLAMILNPDVQAKAQKELDDVLGGGRLPDISDRPQLPYVEAVCKELFRWHTISPTGVPHRTRNDYIYDRGTNLDPLLIPKDSIVMVNLWKLTHDPERYMDPMAFNPARFFSTDLKEPEEDPSRFCFGHGRRCPGKLLADTMVFMMCSAILTLFSISKAEKDGVVVEPQVGYTDTGIVCHPLPFECVVEPRNTAVLALVHDMNYE